MRLTGLSNGVGVPIRINTVSTSSTEIKRQEVDVVRWIR